MHGTVVTKTTVEDPGGGPVFSVVTCRYPGDFFVVTLWTEGKVIGGGSFYHAELANKEHLRLIEHAYSRLTPQEVAA